MEKGKTDLLQVQIDTFWQEYKKAETLEELNVLHEKLNKYIEVSYYYEQQIQDLLFKIGDMKEALQWRSELAREEQITYHEKIRGNDPQR